MKRMKIRKRKPLTMLTMMMIVRSPKMMENIVMMIMIAKLIGVETSNLASPTAARWSAKRGGKKRFLHTMLMIAKP